MTERDTTKAMLSALAGGASLQQALSVAAQVSDSASLSEALRQASAHVEDENFRRESMESLPLEPPVVGLIFGRGERDSLKPAAELALRAMAPEARPLRLLRRFSGVSISASIVAVTSFSSAVFLSGIPMLKLDATRLYLGHGLALAGLFFTLLSFLGEHARAPKRLYLKLSLWMLSCLFFPPVTVLTLPIFWSSFVREIGRAPMDTSRVLLWLAAADRAGILPGAVIAGLEASARGFSERRLLRSLEPQMRGATDMRVAVQGWLRSQKLSADLVRFAVTPFEEPAHAFAARASKLFSSRAPGRWGASAGGVAMLLVIAAVSILSLEIMTSVFRLAEAI